MPDSINPYASPQPSEMFAPTFAPNVRPVLPYLSGHGRATGTMALLGICIALSAALIVSSLMQIQLLETARGGAVIDPAAATANDQRHGALAIADLLAHLVTAVAFLMWFHRAHRNLPALLATQIQYSPGWAVGGWFVPFLNLVRPCQVMSEIHLGSDPARIHPVGRPYSQTMVYCWWTAWIISGILSQISFRVGVGSTEIHTLIATSWVDVATSLVGIAAGVFAIILMRTIDRAQTERILKVSAAPPAAALAGGWQGI